MGAMELQIFVSLLVVLGAAFVALICDFLKGSNEKLREVNIELLVRQEERERAGSPRQWGQQTKINAPEAAVREVPVSPVDIQPAAQRGATPSSVVEGLPAYPRRRRTARPADPQPIHTPVAVQQTPAAPVASAAQAAVEEWARSLVERGAAVKTEDESHAGAAAAPVESVAQSPGPQVAVDQPPVVEAAQVEPAVGAIVEAADQAPAAEVEENQPAAVGIVPAIEEPLAGVAIVEQTDRVEAEQAPAETANAESGQGVESEPALQFALQVIAEPLPVEAANDVTPVAAEAAFENALRDGETSIERAVHLSAGFGSDSKAELPVCGPAAIDAAATLPGGAPGGSPIEPLQAARADGVMVTLEVALPAELSIVETAGLVELPAGAIAARPVPARLPNPAAIQPAQTTILPVGSQLATTPPDWGGRENEEAAVALDAAPPAENLALAPPDKTAAESAPEEAPAPAAETEFETGEPPVEEVVRVRVLDLGDFIDLSGAVETPLEPIGAVLQPPRSRSLAPVYPFQVPQSWSLQGAPLALDKVRLTPPAETAVAADAGSLDAPGRHRADEIDIDDVDAVAAEIVHGAEDLEWPYAAEGDESDFAAPQAYEEAEPGPVVVEDAGAGEPVQAPETVAGTDEGPGFIAVAANDEIEVEPRGAVTRDGEETEPEPEYVAPLVSDEIAPVPARGEHFIDLENELEAPPKVVQMPAPVQAEDSGLTSAPQPQIPNGIHDRQTLAGLLEQQIEFQGVVFFLGLLGYEHLIAEHGQALVRQSVESANEYLESLMGDRGFGCWTEDAAFLMLLPAESGDQTRELSRRTAEALWDYQLRSLGSLPLIFHWGCANAEGDALASVIEMARDQMTESGRARKQVLSASGRFRRKVVNG